MPPIYATCNRLPQSTQDKIFQMTKDKLLTKLKQYIQSWINISKSYIKDKLRIIKQQQKASTQDIHQFSSPGNGPLPKTVLVFFILPYSYKVQ